MKLLELQELFGVLSCHAKRYPLARPEDFVKLLYQNEFGPGHLVTDVNAATAWCLKELETVEKNPISPAFEDIGNGLVRVNFGAIPEAYTPISIVADFVATAEAHKGSMERFLEKLQALEMFISARQMAFSTEDFKAYASAYREAGCPMLSHSETYRNAYRPAYRVVKKSLLSCQEAAE